jgi:hypothetical protein
VTPLGLIEEDDPTIFIGRQSDNACWFDGGGRKGEGELEIFTKGDSIQWI